MTPTANIEALNTRFQESSRKVCDMLTKQDALRRELEALYAEAEAAGSLQFAAILKAMADQIGPTGSANGKSESATSKRRGRPSKAATTDTSADTQ